jgi:hypothetical protein
MTGTAIRAQRALSIQQPWASLIIEGFKLVENRTWATKWRGTIAIHAGLKVAEHDADSLLAETGLKAPHPTGYLGTIDLVDVHLNEGIPCCGIWAEDSMYHWRLDNPRPLVNPIPARGMLGLYTPPQDIDWGLR